ncbi:MAG: mandelate racemase/muconate lactonizing enzyme family protein [Hyphomicrobiales bacterium]
MHKLIGGMGRSRVQAYASSINWLDDTTVEEEVAAALSCGFTQIKVKLGRPVAAAIARARLVRRLAAEGVELFVDANWAYDVHEAIAVGRALAELGYTLFEEPIRPDDRAGYALLARHLPIRLAAGESDYVASEAAQMLGDRSIGLVQPDVARAGGITETWRIAELAATLDTGYAPHVGWSGAVCAAASLQLAAAAEAFRTYECMVYSNPLRDRLLVSAVGEKEMLVEGELPVPDGPGLGIEIDRSVLAELRLE